MPVGMNIANFVARELISYDSGVLDINATDSSDLCDSSTSNLWTEGQSTALRVIPAIGATLSLCGCVFIIFTYFYFNRMRRNGAYQLILYMSCCDLMASFSYLLGIASNPGAEIDCTPSTLCYVQASLSQFFEVASFFWILCIAYNIHTVLVAGSDKWTDYRMHMYHGVSWGVPLLLLAGAAATGSLGDAGAWCWIPGNKQAARILCYYLWLLLIMIGVTMIIFKVMNSLASGTSSSTDAVNKRLRLYVLVFIIMHVPSVINRLQNLIAPDSPMFLLYLAQGIFEPLNGFANSVVYGLNKMVFKQYQENFSICAKKPSPSAEMSNLRSNSPKDGSAMPVADADQQ